MTNILEHFPYDEPRPSQLKVLQWIEANWNRYDVFVLSCPVAAGKSGLAVTIGNWANYKFGDTCSITTPDNVLVGQYRRDFKLPTLPRKAQFASGDLFRLTKERFKEAPLKIMNNYTLLANRVYSDVQIMDEAHELIPMLQDFEGVKVWKHLEPYPESIKTAADVLIWAASRGPKDKLGSKLTRLLSKNPTDYTIVHEEEPYRGKIRKCLRIYPLTPKNNKPILWPPSKVRKLILMSATIAAPDVMDLGLHNRRVGYIEVPSDIPAENRPFIYVGQGSMGRAGQSKSLPKAMEKINALHKVHGGRGFIHSTYGISGGLSGSGISVDYAVHDSFNKQDYLNSWLTNKDDNRTFFGSGLTTGLNLAGDICKWQAILKCQFPDLVDPAVAAKAAQNPEWYAWTTIKQIIQAYGRVCRSPDDYGETYMLDSDFIMLYTKYKHLWPKWFTESVQL